MKTRGLFFGDGRLDRMLLEILDRSLNVVYQQRAEVPAETVPDKNPLDGEILTIRGQRIGGDLPAARS